MELLKNAIKSTFKMSEKINIDTLHFVDYCKYYNYPIQTHKI